MNDRFERLDKLFLERRKLLQEVFPESTVQKTDTILGARQALLDYYDELIKEEIFHLQQGDDDDDGD